MAKNNFPPVSDCTKSLKGGMLKPVYFISGEDSYSINKTADEIIKSVSPFIFSEFDKAVYRGGEDNSLSDILTLATTFPFGSEKKLVIVKDFEKFKDKKSLVGYLDSPPDFTVLLLINNGLISTPSSEPFKSLLTKDYIFEAKELKGKRMVQWVIDYAEENSKQISEEDARMLVEIVGENRALIQDQLEKIITFTADNMEITRQDISFLAAEMKEYTIFDLLDAVGRKEADSAFKYAYNLLDKGKGAVFIVVMLTKYFTALSRIGEIAIRNLPAAAAAKELEIPHWNYKDYVNARRLYSEDQLVNAAEALLKADVAIKTSSTGDKTIISVLLGEILSS